MRVLRLSTSDDRPGRVAAGQAAHEVVERILRDATGEAVETVVRPIWPDESLPDLIDRWMERYEPDLVFLRVNGFWFQYESVPLKIERKFGRLGKPLARAGTRMGEVSWLARSRTFRRVQYFALRVLGGATHFTTDQVIASMEECMRRIIAHEHVGLVVRGTDGRRAGELPGRSIAAYERRRKQVESALAGICAGLHVRYMGTTEMFDRNKMDAMLGADRFHRGAEGHLIAGEAEGVALLKVWHSLGVDTLP
ncbi:MAG: hypothetical protein ABI939_09960 [Anaerolineaceae bacterium]